MFAWLTRILLALRSVIEARASREAEILVLRQQLLVLNRKSSVRLRLRNIDRLILVWLYRFFPFLLDAVVVVKPETLLRWHRRGFRYYWRWKSWRRGGRPRIDRDINELIRRMSRENPLWGAGHGVLGTSQNGEGVLGQGGDTGVFGRSASTGVHGISEGSGIGAACMVSARAAGSA